MESPQNIFYWKHYSNSNFLNKDIFGGYNYKVIAQHLIFVPFSSLLMDDFRASSFVTHL